MKKIFVLLAILISVNLSSYSQEFLGNVQIQTQGIEGVDPSVFTDMERAIFDFMNNRVWTSYNFQIEERIGFTFVITIREVSGSNMFKGSMNVVLERPVYGTDYNTVLLNIVDDNIMFEFSPHQTLDFSESSYITNLTSILGYYAYLMLGITFDTYSLNGGTEFYDKAQDVVNAAQNSNEQGWQAFDGPKTRYQLIENVRNSSYSDLRNLLYDYHRLGLDVMANDKIGGRSAIGKSLKYYQNIYNKRSSLYLLQVLIDAKRNEIIEVFKDGSPAEKVEMLNIMKEVDPANGSRYEAVND